MRTVASDRLGLLERRRAQLDARIEALQAREREMRRRQDTRRKILVGAVVLALAEHHDGLRGWLRARLDERLLRNDERALFDLTRREMETGRER